MSPEFWKFDPISPSADGETLPRAFSMQEMFFFLQGAVLFRQTVIAPVQARFFAFRRIKILSGQANPVRVRRFMLLLTPFVDMII